MNFFLTLFLIISIFISPYKCINAKIEGSAFFNKSFDAKISEENFLINGDISYLNEPIKKVYLTFSLAGGLNDLDAIIYTDSSSINNGRFTFSGKLDYPLQATLTLMPDMEMAEMMNIKISQRDPKYRLTFFLDEGINKIITRDLFSNSEIEGSSAHDEFLRYDSAVSGLVSSLKAAFAKGEDSSKETDSLENLLRTRQKEYLKAHPSSLLSIYLLQELSFYEMAPREIEPLFKLLPVRARTSRQGKEIKRKIELSKKTRVGNTLENAFAFDMNEKRTSLYSFKGELILIDFWASWCGPCRREHPLLRKLNDLYKNKGLTLISISLDTDKKRWAAALKKDSLQWDQLFDKDGFRSEIAKNYAIKSLPTNFLVDKNFKIVDRNIRGEALAKRLKFFFE